MPDGDFVTRVPPEGAAMQFFIESLKANTETMKALRDEIRSEREERKEDRKLLNEIHTRVIKIESSRIQEDVADNKREIVTVKARVDVLEDWKTGEEGGKARLGGTLKHPISIAIFNIVIAAFVAALAIIVGTRLKL